jgi:hypothetical protein
MGAPRCYWADKTTNARFELQYLEDVWYYTYPLTRLSEASDLKPCILSEKASQGCAANQSYAQY